MYDRLQVFVRADDADDALGTLADAGRARGDVVVSGVVQVRGPVVRVLADGATSERQPRGGLVERLILLRSR